ncbi:glycoside hydrolase family 5 protein [Labilibacter sediminis]|nr:glycoside hydrolase family 5 protein [Labilibacter sediminis]
MKFINSLLILVSLFVFSCDNKAEEIPQHEINIQVLPENKGVVEVLNDNTGETIEDLSSIPQGTKVRLNTYPSEGYEFITWSGSIESGNTTSVITLNESLTISALFRKQEGTPVEIYGRLSTKGKYIVDEIGIPVQLRGMSLFWSQWMGKYWNADVVNWLAEDWESSIIRAAMGVDANGGYISKASEKEKVELIVDAAIAKGVYVIIDWHSHHAENYEEEAVIFFTEMAKKYGQYPNVIYEIYNEPLNVSWSDVIKPYAETVIAAIRKHDSDNIILVGTRNWSQEVSEVIGSQIEGENIGYVFHFYASTKGHQKLVPIAEAAIQANIPLFVTEWGVSDASGGGDFNREWTRDWVRFLDKHKLSWCNWSIADKDETASALIPGANVKGHWVESELSESGVYIRNVLRSHRGYSNP